MSNLLSIVKQKQFVKKIGKVSQLYGLIIESTGPDVCVGEICEISVRNSTKSITAEVVGIKDNKVLLMPYADLHGIEYGSEVIATGETASISVCESMLGRVVDAFGNPIDDKDALSSFESVMPIYPEPINPLKRNRINEILETGVKTIDSLLTVGKGQRIGIFSGSGVGKSTLLGMIARNINADVNVIALIGERGREVVDFIEDILGEEGLKKSIVVVAASDQPALVRRHAAYTATTIAEYFRNKEYDVVLTMDSVTRFAMALREIGLAIGEPPTTRGYTPSVFAALPKLLERTGTKEGKGSITAFYTVLIEGDDMNNPVIDSLKSILDGHITLSRELANRGHYPAISVLESVSRLLLDLTTDDERKIINKLISIVSTYEKSRDMIDMGVYRSGNNHEIDTAIKLMPAIEQYLEQGHRETVSRLEGFNMLKNIVNQI